MICGISMNCQKCSTDIWRYRRSVVMGHGPSRATLILVGEAPGAQEDLLGRPFIGPAGKILDNILEAAGIPRSDVYITNVVKCRPVDRVGKNRQPTDTEITICSSYLLNEISTVNPFIVSPMGATATSFFLPGLALSAGHGKILEWRDRTLIPLYHPAVAIYNRNMLPTLVADMRVVKSYMDSMNE